MLAAMSFAAALRSITESEITEQEAAILDFENSWFTASVPKDQAIMEHFELSATRYYQVLNELIDTPRALAHSPLLVKRLRRQRASRQAARSARRLGTR